MTRSLAMFCMGVLFGAGLIVLKDRIDRDGLTPVRTVNITPRRMIGVTGDTVEVRQGEVYINGKKTGGADAIPAYLK